MSLLEVRQTRELKELSGLHRKNCMIKFMKESGKSYLRQSMGKR